MNTPRIFVAAAWLASLAVAYFVGTSGETARHSSATTPAPTPAPTASADAGPVTAPGDEASRAEVRSEKKNGAMMLARAHLERGGGGTATRGMLRALASLTELDEAQLQEALAAVEHSPLETDEIRMFYGTLLGLWAETDGRAAMAYVQGKLGKGSPYRLIALDRVLSNWVVRDPDAVWKWFETQPKDDMEDNILNIAARFVFKGMAAHHLEAALARLNTLNDPLRTTAALGITEGVSDNPSRRRLLDHTASLPPDQRDQIRKGVIPGWALSAPDEVVAWIRALPADEQKSMRDSASNSLLSVKPALAAEFMLEGATEKDKLGIWSQIMSGWAEKGTVAAGEWLTKQPQGPELDDARTSYALLIASRDPAAAMDWARSVQNEKNRTPTVGMVYWLWHDEDPTAAAAALRASGLPLDTVNQLLQKPPILQKAGETLVLSGPLPGGGDGSVIISRDGFGRASEAVIIRR